VFWKMDEQNMKGSNALRSLNDFSQTSQSIPSYPLRLPTTPLTSKQSNSIKATLSINVNDSTTYPNFPMTLTPISRDFTNLNKFLMFSRNESDEFNPKQQKQTQQNHQNQILQIGTNSTQVQDSFVSKPRPLPPAYDFPLVPSHFEIVLGLEELKQRIASALKLAAVSFVTMNNQTKWKCIFSNPSEVVDFRVNLFELFGVTDRYVVEFQMRNGDAFEFYEIYRKCSKLIQDGDFLKSAAINLSDIPPLQSPPLARNFERQNSGEHEISTSPIRSKKLFSCPRR